MPRNQILFFLYIKARIWPTETAVLSTAHKK